MSHFWRHRLDQSWHRCAGVRKCMPAPREPSHHKLRAALQCRPDPSPHHSRSRDKGPGKDLRPLGQFGLFGIRLLQLGEGVWQIAKVALLCLQAYACMETYVVPGPWAQP